MGLSKKIKELKYNNFFNGITFGKIFISGLLLASLQSEAKAENFIVSMQHVVAEFNDGLEKAASWDFGTKLNPKTNRYEYIKDKPKIKTSFNKTIGVDDVLEKEKKYYKNVISLSSKLENEENLEHTLDLNLVKFMYRNLYSTDSSSPIYNEIEEKIIEAYNTSLWYSNKFGLKVINNSQNLNFEYTKDIYKMASHIAFYEQKAYEIQKEISSNNFSDFSNYEKRIIPEFLNNIFVIYLEASKFKIDEKEVSKLYKYLSKENPNTKLYKFMINKISVLFYDLEKIENLLIIKNSNKKTLEGVFKEAYSEYAPKEKNIYDEIDSL